MKRFLIIAFLLLASSSYAYSETLYVSDVREITLRTGQGLDHKILEMLKSGRAVEILETGKDWTKIRLATGREGWVLSRYLTSKPPAGLVLKKLQSEHEALLTQTSAIKKQISDLKLKNKTLTEDLSQSTRQLQTLQKKHDTLKMESTQFLELKEKFEQVTSELSEQTRKAENYKTKLNRIQLEHHIKWFLAGGGVLLAGFIIGISARRRKTRSFL